MKEILDKITSNNLLFACVIIILSAILVTLIILIISSLRDNKKINIYEEDLEDEDIKKVKNVKKEDIIDVPQNSKDIQMKHQKKLANKKEEVLEETSEEEIKARYDLEQEEEIEEILEENNNNSEIKELIKEVEDNANLKPEDVIANFEKEQEEQSIISYQELVDVVKNRQDEYFEDELESRPLTTVSAYMKSKENKETTTAEIAKSLAHDMAKRKKEESSSENKFHKTDVISPVFGRMTKENQNIPNEEDMVNIVKPSDINQESAKEMDEIYQHMADDWKKSSDVKDKTRALDRLSKNEEFLQSLKDFRKKL